MLNNRDLSMNIFKKIGVDDLPKTLEELYARAFYRWLV